MGHAQFSSRLERGQRSQGARTLWGVTLAVAFPLVVQALIPIEAQAQSIIPANDGTGTQIQLQGNEFIIQGGSLSQDNANLFHSFDRFNVAANEIATFQSSPDIQNIIGRVLGGEASRIDGILRMSNGTSQLLLINPAGIVSGIASQITAPGGFTATTADRIDFDTASLDSLLSVSDYRSFNGSPTSFEFSNDAQGVILNEGRIDVASGAVIRLIGSQVVNTGQLNAPSGEVTLLSVEGGQTARVETQAITLLPNQELGDASPALALPQLIADEATRLSLEGGQVQLVGTTLPAAGAFSSGELAVASNGSQSGGTVRVLGARVALLNADVNASGSGRIYIGGVFRGGDRLPASQLTVVDSTTTLNADGIGSGDGGEIVIWADGSTGFWGSSSAQGGLFGGDGGQVEVSGLQNLRFEGTANVEAAQGAIGNILLDPQNIIIQEAASLPDDSQLLIDQPPGDAAGQILAGQSADQDFFISRASLVNLSGDVRLEATEDIVVDSAIAEIELPNVDQLTVIAGQEFRTEPNTAIRTFDGNGNSREGSITIQAGRISGGIFNAGNPNSDGLVSPTAGNVNLNATGNIVVRQLLGQNIDITSESGNISLTFDQNADPVTDGSRTVRGQNISLNAPNGQVLLTGGIQAGEVARPEAGTITINAEQFQATQPFDGTALLGPDPTGNDIQPMSLWSYPANVPVGFNLDVDEAPDPFPEGVVEVRLTGGIPQRLGRGETVISINLEADSFAVADGLALGDRSGAEGGIGIALSQVPPNVNPLALNNEFVSFESPNTAVAEVLLDDGETVASAICPTVDELEENEGEILQALAIPEPPPELDPSDLGLPAVEPVDQPDGEDALRSAQADDTDNLSCGRE